MSYRPSSAVSDQRTRLIYIAAITCSFGGLLFGYDTGIISGALLFIRDDFALNSFLQGLVVSSLLIGAMVGALACGRLADVYGRRMLALVAAIIFAVGSIGAAFSPDTVVLIIFRLVLGLGVGLSSVVVPLYISEISPQQVRGSLTSLNQLMITAGILLAYITAFALSPFEAWRWMLGLAIVPAVILFVGMYFMPESPRWLVNKGKLDLAREVLGRTRTEGEVDQEIQELRQNQRQSRSQQAGWGALLARWVRPALIAGIGLAAFQQFIGINTIIYYAPTVFSQIGFGNSTAIAVNVAIGVVNFALTFVAIRLIDRVGRKPLLLTGNVGMALAMTFTGVILLFASASVAAVGLITVACLAVYIAFYAATWGPVMWAMLPELFPANIRGAAEGVATMSNWGANFIVSLLFPVLLTSIGEGPVFLICAVIGVLAFIFVRRRLPETQGKSLEEIEADLRGEDARTRPG